MLASFLKTSSGINSVIKSDISNKVFVGTITPNWYEKTFDDSLWSNASIQSSNPSWVEISNA